MNRITFALTIMCLFLASCLTMVFSFGFGGKGYQRAIKWWHKKAVIEYNEGVSNI